MLKDRTGLDVTTRCGTTIRLKSGQTIRSIGVTGWETTVTCPTCTLTTPRTP
jgi:hypothetical protein